MDSMCIYPTVSTEQMSMLFFICLFVGFTFFLVESVIVLFVFYCFFTGGLFHKGGIQIIGTLKKKMEERTGVFWLSKQDFQKERTKVCTRVLKISYWSRKSKDLKHSPYFTKITTDIVYIDILISILMSESKTLFLSYHLRSKRIVYDKTVISFTVLS